MADGVRKSGIAVPNAGLPTPMGSVDADLGEEQAGPPPPPVADGTSAHRRLPPEVLAMQPAAGLPAAVASQWKIETGRRPMLGGRSPDGSTGSRTVQVDEPQPITTVMADLCRRRLPTINSDDDVRALINEIGLNPTGRLARALRESARLAFAKKLCHELEAVSEGFEVWKPSLECVTTHLIADVLALAADGSGSVNLGQLRGREGYGYDVDRLVEWIGGRSCRPRVKQYEDSPFELRFLESEIGAFPSLRKAVVQEQLHRQKNSMPLLTEVHERYGLDVDEDVVIARQHGFGSVNELASSMAGWSTVIDKNYSSSVPVKLAREAEYPEQGVRMFPVIHDDEAGLLMGSYELGFRGEGEEGPMFGTVVEALHAGRARPGSKLNILDEGGRIILMIHETIDQLNRQDSTWFGSGTKEELIARLSGEEHTRDGIRQLKAMGVENLRFGVINASESPLKLYLAAVVEAWSAAEEAHRTLQDLEAQGLRPHEHLLLVGYGSMGTPIARLLRAAGYQVTLKEALTEADREALAKGAAPPADTPTGRAVQSGFEVIETIPEDAPFDAVVGTTGLPWFNEEEIGRLRSGTPLLSTSSGTKEFPFLRGGRWALDTNFDDAFREQPVGQVQGSEVILGKEGYDRTHWHRVLRDQDGHELLLTNGGYPGSFTGGPDPIEPELIQLVRAVMLMASLEARSLEPGTTGLFDLSREGQLWLAGRFMEIVDGLEPPLPDVVREMLQEAYGQTRAALGVESDD